jgi:membrane associated rhomboid family serine protease
MDTFPEDDEDFRQTIEAAPLNSFILALNVVLWFVHWSYEHGFENISTSFRKVVLERQYYRVITATFSHLNFFHLAFNMESLNSLGRLEDEFGTYWYAVQTVLLIFVGHVSWMGMTYLLVRFGGAARARMKETSAVGYSGVLFGWLALESVLWPESTFIFLRFIPVPGILAPWVALVITHLIIPNASFLGHLSGIVAGYLIGAGGFSWIGPFWLWSAVALLCLIMLLSLKPTNFQPNLRPRRFPGRGHRLG